MAKKNIPGTESVNGGVASFLTDAAAFDNLNGERFAGLNVLKLAAGQAAVGLVVSAIGTQKVKGRGKEKGKTREIPSYSAKAPDGREYRLPLNASFVAKMQDAKVKVGDTVAIRRGDDYVSKEGNRGTSFDLIVQARK